MKCQNKQNQALAIEITSVCPGTEERGMSEKDYEGNFSGGGNVLRLNCCVVYTGVCIYQTSLKCKLKICAFYCI